MKTLWRSLTSLICLVVALMSAVVRAEDIDIFMGRAADNSLPNVIFVLDNTSNWSRQSQGWSSGVVQGQSEVQAIRNALSKQVGKVNVGLFEFRTGDCVDCGYVRFALQPFTETSKTNFNAVVDRIYQNINEPGEKRNAGAPYGDLMLDLYSYLAGRASLRGGAGTPSLADSSGYQTNYSQFKSPLSSASLCGKTSIVFIGNPQLSGPTQDSPENSAALKLLYQGLRGNPDRLAGDLSGMPLALPEISTITTTTTDELGLSAKCYSTKNNELAQSRTACAVDESASTGLCAGKEGCGCSEAGGSGFSCATNTAKFKVTDTQTEVVTSETGRFDKASGAAWNLDDWAKFFNNYGIPVSFSSSGEAVTERHSISLYTIDVYNKQPNAQHSGLLYSAAMNGGGRYFAARNEAAIQLAIEGALSDIISVSSAFAGVSLPLSATTQSRSENQIFVGMFRPDKLARPRWFGNLKRYELGLVNGVVEMVDKGGKPISNRLSGYISECAESYWTVDSANYWESLGITPPPKGQCVGSEAKQWSDLPDGPFVEKGGVGQRLRERSTARVLKTVGANGLVDFATTSAASIGGQQVYDYFIGSKGGSGEILPASGLRASVHGDVVHSRPVAVNYGNGKTIAYYGANDGLFRAVDGANGNEQWALVVPEHFPKLNRLFDNTPLVAFPNQDSAASPKDYFFDGSTGQLLTRETDGSLAQAFIFPTMRRGGRMVYALDVTAPGSPSLLWRHGCQSEGNCTVGFSDIGQTWSMPVAAKIKDDKGNPLQVVIFGGGYDACEDNKTLVASCSEPRGAAVYVLDAESGDLLAKLETERSVAADVAVVDVDNDGFDDYAYAADTGGSVWRISLAQPTATLGLNNSSRIAKAAYTANSNRKFLQAPALTAFKGDVFVALGSGNRERPLVTDYPYQSNVDDRFYVFRDRPSGASLVNLDSSAVTSADDATVECAGASILPGSGWYKPLPGRGEQVANPAAIVGGDVFFNTYQPVGAKPGMCSNQLGLGTGYRLSLFNGSSCGRTPTLMPDGMPTAPIVTTVEVSCGKDCTKVVTVVVGEGGATGTEEIKLAIDPVRSIDYWTNETDN